MTEGCGEARQWNRSACKGKRFNAHATYSTSAAHVQGCSDLLALSVQDPKCYRLENRIDVPYVRWTGRFSIDCCIEQHLDL